MSANFTPDFVGYSGVRPFRWWCQKVLPLVYDDSLSYYELLCKVVSYINNLIADVSACETNIDALKDAFEELQDYVNGYLTDENMQVLVNNKLDEMAEAGELDIVFNSVSHLYVHDGAIPIFEAADEYGRCFAQGLKLVSYDGGGLDGEGGADIGTVLAALKTSNDLYRTTNINLDYGLGIRIVEHEGVVSLDFKSGDTGVNADVPVSGSYMSTSLPDYAVPRYSVQAYIPITARIIAQVNILQNGTFQMGFAKLSSDGSATNIPDGTIVRAHISYVTPYGHELTEVPMT